MTRDQWWDSEWSLIDENAQQGSDAESLLPWLLGRAVQLRKPLRDDGEDYTFTIRGDPHQVEFAVQLKSTRQDRGRFRVRVGKVRRWLPGLSRRPVLFLRKRETDAAEVFWMTTLHEWLLAEPDLLQRIEAQDGGSRVRVPTDLFRRYDRADPDGWRAVLLQEHARVLGTGLLSAPVNLHLDITEDELFAGFGRLTRREVSAAHLRSALLAGGNVQFAAMRLRVLRPPDALTPGPRSQSELEQFGLFITALRHADQDRFPMPEHTWAEVAPWRVFMLMYPNSFVLLDRLFQRPASWKTSQVCSALALLGLLAGASQDSGVRLRAESMLASRELRESMPIGTAANDSSYLVARQYLYACAEAALGDRSEQRFLSFMAVNGQTARGLERQLHRRYYRMMSVADTVPFIERQLVSPAPRQENTREILSEIRGVLEAR